MRPFDPLFRNAHLATIAGNFWTRPELESRWPVRDVYYEPEPGVQTLVRTQHPRSADPRGEVILVHGLEGSSESGYVRSMAASALEAGFIVHRWNMRGCGDSPWHAKANYHSGQTGDLLLMARERKRALDLGRMGNPPKNGLPLFAIGYSLGGNMVLKLAGELGEEGRDLFAGVCAVSAPIDLAASVAALRRPKNFFYQRRFLKRLKERVRKRHPLAPDLYPLEPLGGVKTIYDFDHQYTAKIFGFGTADRYYQTQSSRQFLERICIPTLMVHAKDDPLVPFASYEHPAVRANPHVRLLAVERGGHLGFVARGPHRFWLDHLLTDWLLAGRPISSEAKAAMESS
jgi:predicted alpha/beta-fold hydrolase